MTEDLVERIYEAAFVPDLWSEVLDLIARASHSASGSILVFENAIQPPAVRATTLTRESLQYFITSDAWKSSTRAPHLVDYPVGGFCHCYDFMSPEQVAQDSVQPLLHQLGLDWQIGAFVPMPTSELAVFTFERWRNDGRYADSDIARLDGLRPHLARAGLMAARMRMQQAEATVSALATIGLPAAVISGAGQVLTVNDLLERLSSIFLPVARGGMAIADEAADRLFQESIEATRRNVEPLVRSIPIPAREDRPALVVHVLPLSRSAYDIFSSGRILIVATLVGSDQMLPSPTILTGLFDLTPAEARLAIALAAGRSLKNAAVEGSLTLKTCRTYLDRIFVKTGTHQQSELVALLKSAPQFPEPNR